MAAPRVWGDTPQHTIVVDWDGTVVAAEWPGRPTKLMPGAADALRRFHQAGHPVVIFSARLNPRDPWTGEDRSAEAMADEIQYIRDTLDAAGLTFVEIYNRPGKPGGSVYIDDKAERYNGGTNSWSRLADKILLRLDGEEPVFPYIPEEVTA